MTFKEMIDALDIGLRYWDEEIEILEENLKDTNERLRVLKLKRSRAKNFKEILEEDS